MARHRYQTSTFTRNAWQYAIEIDRIDSTGVNDTTAIANRFLEDGFGKVSYGADVGSLFGYNEMANVTLTFEDDPAQTYYSTIFSALNTATTYQLILRCDFGTGTLSTLFWGAIDRQSIEVRWSYSNAGATGTGVTTAVRTVKFTAADIARQTLENQTAAQFTAIVDAGARIKTGMTATQQHRAINGYAGFDGATGHTWLSFRDLFLTIFDQVAVATGGSATVTTGDGVGGANSTLRHFVFNYWDGAAFQTTSDWTKLGIAFGGTEADTQTFPFSLNSYGTTLDILKAACESLALVPGVTYDYGSGSVSARFRSPFFADDSPLADCKPIGDERTLIPWDRPATSTTTTRRTSVDAGHVVSTFGATPAGTLPSDGGSYEIRSAHMATTDPKASFETIVGTFNYPYVENQIFFYSGTGTTMRTCEMDVVPQHAWFTMGATPTLYAMPGWPYSNFTKSEAARFEAAHAYALHCLLGGEYGLSGTARLEHVELLTPALVTHIAAQCSLVRPDSLATTPYYYIAKAEIDAVRQETKLNLFRVLVG